MHLFAFLASHAYYILVAVSAIPMFMWFMEFRKDLDIDKIWLMLLIQISIFAVGLLSVTAVVNLENYLSGQGLANRRGWAIFFTTPIYLLIGAKVTKRDPKMVTDIFVVQILIAYFFGRTACLFQGCCIGKIIPGTEFRWPLREAELLFVAIFIYVLGRKAYRRSFDGRSFPMFLTAYGFFRFFLEFLREPLHAYFGPFSSVQIGCIIFFLMGVFWLLILYIQNSRTKKSIIDGGKK